MRYVVYILVLASSYLNAQTKVLASKEYLHVYGGKNFDEARDVKELPGKNYIIAGTTSSFGQGNTSAYLIKTDSVGKHKWSMPFGGSQNDWAYAVEVTADSGYFVAGYSNSFNPPNGYDAWYFKVDKNGNLVWQKTISGYDWDFIYGCTPLPDSGYVLCGESYTNSNGNADGYLARIDKNGDTLWTKHFGGALDEKLNGVCIINNRIYATGVSSTNDLDTLSDGWLLKTDLSGNLIAETFFAGPPRTGEEFRGITAYDANTFFVYGCMEWKDSSSTQSLIAKTDTSLNFLFGPYAAGLTGAGEYVCFNRVTKTSYGNICVAGTATGGLGGLNLFLVGLHGDLTWINDFAHDSGIQYDETGNSVIYTTSGRIIAVGNCHMLCGSNPGLGLEDVFMVRFETDSIENQGINQTIISCFSDTLFYWAASQQEYSNNPRLRFYPNPVNYNAIIEINAQSLEAFNLGIYNLLGEEVRRFKVMPGLKHEINLEHLPNGSYYLKMEDKTGLNLTTLKFIVNH